MSVINGKFNEFRSDFEISVRNLEEKYGVKMKLGSISYNDTEFSSKLQVVAVKAGQEGLSIGEIEWNKHAESYGFNSDDLGKTFVDKRSTYKIVGWNNRSNKYKVLLQKGDKTIRGTVGYVESFIKK